MGVLELFLLALGLAADCFTVSVAGGVLLRRVNWPLFFRMAFFFGLFQAVMPLLGWLGGSTFSGYIQPVDHWVAFGLLSFLGFKMVAEGCKPQEEARFDPSRLSYVLVLAVGTSIDAFAVGITFAFMGYGSLTSLSLPLWMIGIVSFFASVVGSCLGAWCGRRMKFRMEFVGGIVLIAIGLRILIEHLVTE